LPCGHQASCKTWDYGFLLQVFYVIFSINDQKGDIMMRDDFTVNIPINENLTELGKTYFLDYKTKMTEIYHNYKSGHYQAIFHSMHSLPFSIPVAGFRLLIVNILRQSLQYFSWLRYMSTIPMATWDMMN
jgi:hypothetical protein